MRTATLSDYKLRLMRVLVRIQEGLDDHLELDKLARVACFSPYHFHRIFKGMMGESVKEYVRRLRLERAATHLKLTRRPVTRVAFDAGYASHEAFTRSFRTAFGVSPSAFRTAKQGPGLAKPPSGLHYVPGGIVRHFRTHQRKGRDMQVTIVQQKPIRVVFMRHVGPYSGVGEAWERFLPLVGKEGLLGGDAIMLGLSHDDPEVTPPHRVRYDACVSVDEHFAPFGDVGVQVIPGGAYAMATHFGPYHKLGETYSKLLGHWLPRSRRELRSSPCFEIYLNDPHSTEPEDLLTDIYAPLED